jgi:hypothetical protein
LQLVLVPTLKLIHKVWNGSRTGSRWPSRRTNLTQERAGEVFGVSQATVSRRWDLIRPTIGAALAPSVRAQTRWPGRERCWWTA